MQILIITGENTDREATGSLMGSSEAFQGKHIETSEPPETRESGNTERNQFDRAAGYPLFYLQSGRLFGYRN